MLIAACAFPAQKDYSCQDACNKVVYYTESSFTQLAVVESDVSTRIKERFKAAIDLHSRVDSLVSQRIVYKLDTIIELMKELKQSLEFQVTDADVAVYGRVQGAIKEMIHHVDEQNIILFGVVQKYKEDYMRYLHPSIKFFSANIWSQQNLLMTISNHLWTSEYSWPMDNGTFSKINHTLQHVRNSLAETLDFIVTFLERKKEGKISAPRETAEGVYIFHLPNFYANARLREKCPMHANSVNILKAHHRFIFDNITKKVHALNESDQSQIDDTIVDFEYVLHDLEEVKSCFLDYSNALAGIEERHSQLHAGTDLFIDKMPLLQIADALNKGQNNIFELANNYIANRSQVSDLAESVSNKSNKYYKHFEAPGLAESVAKNAADPLLKYAAEQQQLLLSQLEGALQDHLLLYDYVENDTLTAVARRLEIWRRPIPSFELDQVSVCLKSIMAGVIVFELIAVDCIFFNLS